MMSRALVHISLGLVLAVCALLGGGQAWADQVSVRATQQTDSGRITFRWPQPVGHQAVREGDRLVVTFSRPIEADLRPVLRNLNAIVQSIEPAPNDTTVVLRIKGEFQVRSYDAGASVVVDIVSARQQAQPKAQPQTQQATQQAAATGPSVPVRTGVHPAYSRVVFDWPSRTAFSLLRDGENATLVFDVPGSADVSRLAGGRIRNILGATTTSADGKLSVTLRVDPTSRVNAFASGPKVVVDVYPRGSQQAAATPDTTPAAAAPQPTPEQAAPAEPAAAPQSPAAPIELKPQAPAAAPATAQAEAQPEAPTTPQAEPQAPPQPEEPLELTRAEAQQFTEGAVELRFNWDEPVGAAVFRRANVLWVVFDKRAKIDTQALVQDGAGMITSVEQVPSVNGAVMRMTTPEGINPGIKRAGLAWVLEFMPQPLLPSAPLQADADPNSPVGARVFISVPEPGNVIAFRDPEVGDNLVVVPVIPLGHGISRTWVFPQMKVLPSKQGVVVKPVSDDVRVRQLRTGVELTSTGDLHISNVTAEERAAVDLQSALEASAGMEAFRPLTRVLDLEKWKRADLQDFTQTRQDLQARIASAGNSREREQMRRELILFYFTQGFQAEALGVLETMRSERPEVENEPEFRMLRGAASWLMSRMDDARRDLYHESLNGNDEATFWRAAVVAGEGHMVDAAYDLRRKGAITMPYPKAIKMPSATLVAAAAVELGDVKQASQYLEMLAVDDPSVSQRNQIEYVSGLMNELSGEPDAAVADWESAMEGVHRPSRAKAAVARTELLLKQDMFTPMDAIEEFEKLRFVWRGDDFEFELLRRLGTLYLQEGLYRDGLRTLRQAATNFPKHEMSKQVTKQMADAFNALYMDNGADALAPVTAIALYDEFRELTPAGAKGDEMIRKLADRLVGVDLLSRAADLLESQVDFRLTGEERARVGARLALIYLLDRGYEQALMSLDKTQATGLPEELATERVLLRAQAHIGLEQPQMALELLRPEISLAAEKMRSGIYWRAGDWKEASKSLAAVTRGVEAKPRKPLDDTQAVAVLSLAISYTLSGNEAGVARTLANYGQAMMQTAYADAFQLISDPPERGLVNYRALGDVVKKVEDFQGFMEAYRQRVAEGQLSSLY